MPNPEEQDDTKEQKRKARRQKLRESRHYHEIIVNACLLGHTKNPYKERLRDAIRNRNESYSRSIIKASSGLMHSVETYRDVTHIKTVEVPEEVFDRTFIRHLMLGREGTSMRNERVHALHENCGEQRFNGTRYGENWKICCYGTMEYLRNLKNHLTVNLGRFMIRSIFFAVSGSLSQRDMDYRRWHL